MANRKNDLAAAQAELQLRHYRLRKQVGKLREDAHRVLNEAKSKGITRRRRTGTKKP